VQVFTALAVLDVDEDELLDPARAEVLLGSDGVGVAVLVILEVVDDVNTSVVAALVAEDDVLLLEAGAEADVELLVPPAVLGNAVSATVEGPEVEVLASPVVLEDVAFALGENPNEPSSPVKLGAGLASLAPIGVSMHCGGVVGPVESATIEVQVSTEVKSDSAWSDTGHGTGEEYTASPLRVIIYPPPDQKRPPTLITVDTNTTALDITNKAAILVCMSPTYVDAHYLYFGTRNKHTTASTLQEIGVRDYGVIRLLMPLL